MLFQVDDYFESPNSDYRGNPLITAFPQIDQETIAALMENRVNFDEIERTHSADLRIQYVMRLLNFFLPLNHQIEFCMKLWSLILYGYKRRNPLKKATADTFAKLMAQIKERTLTASSDGTAFDAMLCALLIGSPGTGKSTSVKSLLARLGPGLLHHAKHGATYQLLSLTVQAPKNGSARSLAQDIFIALRNAGLETGQLMPYIHGRMPKTEGELTQAITELAQKLNLGVLVLDELQHLYRGADGSDNDAMKFLTGVINRIGIPVLLVGTWECMGLLGLEARIARRATGPADAQYRRMRDDVEWEAFMDVLFSYQFTQNVVELTAEMRDKFYFHTQGVQDLAVKLMIASQIDAILDESECLSEISVEASAVRHFSLIAPVVRMLREGRRETDPILWDLEPSDLNDYMQAFATKARVTVRRGWDRRAINAARKVGLAEAVAASLEATQNVGPEDAAALALASVEAAPHLPASDHVAQILTETTALAPRPTKSKSAKRQQEVAEAILGFDAMDLRRILFVASRESSGCEGIEAALHEAKHLGVLAEEFA